MPQLDQLRPEDFEPLIGHSIPVEVHGSALACELTHVRRLPPHTLRTNSPFSLILRGPRNQPFGQGTYPLLHPEHGRLSLFVVPLGPDGAGLGYEITFN
jgi:hypothetical protein